MNIIAHIRKNEAETTEIQPLAGPNGHLEGVAQIASEFANAFNASEFAKCAGIWGYESHYLDVLFL